MNSIALLMTALSSTDTLTEPQEDSFDTELQCLAQNVYFEARNQSIAGMYAVGHVVLNRINSDEFPRSVDGKISTKEQRQPESATVCSIVKDAKLDSNKNPIKNMCQFSWYCDGEPEVITDNESWELAEEIAHDLLIDRYYEFDFTGGALYYHADYVSPEWRNSYKKTIQILDHIYYK